jgi:hypothetical protein
MNIITVFNYQDDNKYNDMFKIWVLQALNCKYNTPGINKVKILTEGINDKLKKFAKKLNTNDLIIEIRERKPLKNVPHRWLHNVGFKLYNVCQEKEPFVFVDADAIIMKNMNDVIKASKDKPFISTDHQTIPKHTDKFNYKFMNTGFFIVSDVNFLNFDKIYNSPQVFKCTGTDQYLLNNYCKLINYDYTHPTIHYGWNSCGGYKIEIGNKIYSYGIPEKHEIYILHYWDVFKPWITPCDIYNKLQKKYTLFDIILDKIIFENFENIFSIFIKSFDEINCVLYCYNEEVYKNLKYLNFKGKTILHKEKLNNYKYITEL